MRGSTFVFIVCCCLATVARAQELPFESALARARTVSPVIRSGEAEVAAAQTELSAESRIVSENPTVEAIAGTRRTPMAETTNDYVITLDQPLSIAGRRAARIESARAALDIAMARRDVLLRDALAEAATAYVRAAAATARFRIAQQDENLAREIEHIAQRRFDVGDVAVIEVNATKADAAQARAETAVAEGERDSALARLRALLGYAPDAAIAVNTDLMALVRQVPATVTTETPQVRQAEADLRQARARVALARAQARPDFGFVVEQAREENNRILLGGGRITLPVFNRGRPEIQAAQERVRGAEAQLEMARLQAEADRRAALIEFDRRRAAATLLQNSALPLLTDNERLIARSYEVGEIDLAELLTLRRQTNTIRMSAIARVQEAAQAWIELLRATGAPPFVSGER